MSSISEMLNKPQGDFSESEWTEFYSNLSDLEKDLVGRLNDKNILIQGSAKFTITEILFGILTGNTFKPGQVLISADSQFRFVVLSVTDPIEFSMTPLSTKTTHVYIKRAANIENR